MDSRNIIGHKGLSGKRNSKSQNHTPSSQLHLLSPSYTSNKKKQQKQLLHKSQSVTEKYEKKLQNSLAPSYEQLSLHIRMKEKFEDLYKKIKKISIKNGWDESANKQEQRFIVYPSEEIQSPTHKNRNKRVEAIKQELTKMTSGPFWDQNASLQKQLSASNLEINTTSVPKSIGQEPIFQIKFLKNNRYKPRLLSNKKTNMSNNIRDYLSVEKINIRDETSPEKSVNLRKRASGIKDLMEHNFIERAAEQLQTNLLFQRRSRYDFAFQHDPLTSEKSSPTLPRFQMNRSLYRSKKVTFDPPFETYYYRDLIWRVAYSNQHSVQSPPEYQSKIKIYIGRGNNSRLIKSIINRRSWYQITDKINDASVIWTQIKVQSIFNWQSKNHSTSFLKKSVIFEDPCKQDQIYKGSSIWTQQQDKKFRKYFEAYRHVQQKMNTDFKFRNKKLKPGQNQINLPSSTKKQQKVVDLNSTVGVSSISPLLKSQSAPSLPKIKIHNHIINNYIIGNKKALFQTMKQYYQKNNDDAFKYLPVTFHICNGLDDDQYLKFLNMYYSFAKKTGNNEDDNSKYNAWIVKPGQNTNRGNGIIMCLTLDAIKAILKKKQKHYDGSQKTYIIQKYIEKPMLYRKRKFDIRHYIMVNCSNRLIKGYWYKPGYLRTTSSQYTLKQSSCNVHLTNDAVQKQLPDYGKYEKGNKLSYDQFHEYLQKINPEFNFWKKVYPQMKKIATDIIKASAHNLDPARRTNNFEVFGMDFMLDSQMNVWLIQVNSNPCLEVSAPILAKIIPRLIEQTFEICLDPIFPPPLNFSPKGATFNQNCLNQLDFQIIYDQRFESKSNAGSKLLNDAKFMKEEDDYFEDDGEQLNED